MSNSIAFAEAYTKALDKEIVAKAKTGIFADNAVNAFFSGGHTVNIPKVSLVGLGNYTDADGYPAADTTLSFVSYTVAMDRGREMGIDRIAANQSGLGNLAGELGREYIRTKVVPEMDAYCISKLATYAEEHSQTVSTTSGTTKPIAVFNDLLSAGYNALDYDEEFVIFVNNTLFDACLATDEVSRQLGVADFKNGEIQTRIRTYNGVPIIPVKGSLMKDAFTFDAGGTATSGGFAPREASGSGESAVAAAKDVYALLVPRKGVMFCKNLEKVKVFSPDQNQDGDRWKLQIRVFYDYFLKDSHKAGIRAYVSAS